MITGLVGSPAVVVLSLGIGKAEPEIGSGREFVAIRHREMMVVTGRQVFAGACVCHCRQG